MGGGKSLGDGEVKETVPQGLHLFDDSISARIVHGLIIPLKFYGRCRANRVGSTCGARERERERDQEKIVKV